VREIQILDGRAMTVSYDPTLVMLSIFVAITGALTGLAVTAGYDRSGRRNYALSIIKGAVIIGGSIWSMHFVAMLAVRLPIAINYNFVKTIFSLYIAMVGTGLGLFIVSKRRLGAVSVPTGGLLMGAAIGGMHYLGMDAIQGCGLTYSRGGVLASVVIAVTASAIALWFTFRRRGTTETLFGGLMLGLTIPSMHYTAMVATTFVSLPTTFTSTAPMLSQDTLAFIIATSTFVICGIFLFLFSSLAISGAEPAHQVRGAKRAASPRAGATGG
jgi:NO-binding membrane sensor protein with MHYT domain